MKASSIPNLTILSSKKQYTLLLPKSFQQLKEYCQSIFKGEPKILYLDNKDIIEIDSEDSFLEYVTNTQFNSKVLYLGSEEDNPVESAAHQLQEYLRTNNADQQAAMHCMKCYGTKTNKRGDACPRCNGTGEICEKDLKIIANCVQNLVSTHVENSLASMKLAISQIAEKEKPITTPIKKCDKCLNQKQKLCEVDGKMLCENCMESNKKVEATPEYKSKMLSNNLASDPFICHQSEKVNFTIEVENSGSFQWHESTTIYPVVVEPINDRITQCSSLVGSVKSSEKANVLINVEMPKEQGIYKVVWKLGYKKESSIAFFGGNIQTKFMVTFNHGSEAYCQQDIYKNNLKQLVLMGYNQYKADIKLKEAKNDLHKAIELLNMGYCGQEE